MPDTRLAKTRASLPEGYQFGDASLNARMGCPFGPTVTRESRDQLQVWDRNRGLSAMTPPLTGHGADYAGRECVVTCSCVDWMTCDHPWPTIVRSPLRFHPLVYASTIPPQPTDGWNVIEGDHFDAGRDTGDETPELQPRRST